MLCYDSFLLGVKSSPRRVSRGGHCVLECTISYFKQPAGSSSRDPAETNTTRSIALSFDWLSLLLCLSPLPLCLLLLRRISVRRRRR
jgi:hypothetical protein